MIIKPRNCGNCGNRNQLSNVPRGEPDGECRAAPPQIVTLPHPAGVSVQTLFPRVKNDWDCGMWKAKIDLVATSVTQDNNVVPIKAAH